MTFCKTILLGKNFDYTYEGCQGSGQVGDSPHCRLHKPQGRCILYHLPGSLAGIGHICGNPVVVVVVVVIIIIIIIMIMIIIIIIIIIITTRTTMQETC
jgi:phage shock protein PspC (stress-responsive transcriptional regulator)